MPCTSHKKAMTGTQGAILGTPKRLHAPTGIFGPFPTLNRKRPCHIATQAFRTSCLPTETKIIVASDITGSRKALKSLQQRTTGGFFFINYATKVNWLYTSLTYGFLPPPNQILGTVVQEDSGNFG